jgi:hypothetical protein
MTTFELRYGLDGNDEKIHYYSFSVTPEEMTKTHTINVKSDDPYDGFNSGYYKEYTFNLDFTDYNPDNLLDIKTITLSQKA